MPVGNNKIVFDSTTVSDVSFTSAIITSVLQESSEIKNISQYGHCWSNTPNPDIFKDHSSLTSVISGRTFESNLSNLSPGGTYYCRPYFILNSMPLYGSEFQFSTNFLTIPSVTTQAAFNYTQTTVNSGGYVTSGGGTPVTVRGVCWSKIRKPTIDDSLTTDGIGTGVFKSELTGLTSGTPYYIRAYATNSIGTAYGNELCFTPLIPCGSSFSIHHLISGGVAPVDKITSYSTINNIPGETSKCWIISNLGADHQATAVSDSTEASAGWYWQFNHKQGYKNDGVKVTPSWTITEINENSEWIAANDPCALELGTGWRIPTYTEWSNVVASGNWTNWNGPWSSSLKIHASGFLNVNNGSLSSRGADGDYWCSIQYGSTNGWRFGFYNGNGDVNHNSKVCGFTLRCLRD